MAKKNPEFLSFRKKKRKRKEEAKKKKKKKQKKEFLSERLPKDRGADRGLGLLLLLLLSGIVFFFFLERKRYPRSGGRVDNIGKWSGRYGGRKAWNKKRKKEKKKSRAPSGVVAGCPRASFRDAPHGGGLWGHDGGAVPGPCNLKSSQGGSRGWGGGNNPGTPHGRSASPPYSSATMQQTHEKFTLQSAAKKSNVLREACALLPTMEPAIASLLTGETICADC